MRRMASLFLTILILGVCSWANPTPSLPDQLFSCPYEISSGTSYFQTAKELRSVQFWVSLTNEKGPLYVYWHGTGNQPIQVLDALGSVVDEILSKGGMIAAPFKSSRSGAIPWFFTEPDDLDLMDMIVSCAVKSGKVDVNRIHSFGYSAGGILTARLALERSKYIASVVTYSGGILPGRSYPFGNPENHFAAMAFHGGSSDIVLVSFKDTTSKFMKKLKQNSAEHLFLTCDHGKGHSIPSEGYSVHSFFQDHPFGAAPSPYETELPSFIPSYCVKSEFVVTEPSVDSSCESGYYFDSKDKICISCPANSDSPVNSTSITQCECLPGYTKIDKECKACHPGTFKEKSGDDPCDFCPDYSISPAASTSLYNCECIEGYTGKEGEECKACPANSYKNGTGFSICISCPINTHSPIAATNISQCVCNNGFNSFVGESYECTAVSIVVLSVTIGGMIFLSALGGLFWLLRRTNYYQRAGTVRGDINDEIEQESLIQEENK